MNPINLMIEHRQDLALSDTQFMKVIAIKRVLDSTNAPLVRKLDSVQRLFKKAPLFSEPSPQRRDSLAQARALVQGNDDRHRAEHRRRARQGVRAAVGVAACDRRADRGEGAQG